ncbi:MAG: FG-GAP repeat domain-containing protein [Polyangiales bacterium]
MNVRRDHLLVLACALAACHSDQMVVADPASPTPSPSVDDAGSPDAAPPHAPPPHAASPQTVALCNSANEANAALLAHPTRSCTKASMPSGEKHLADMAKSEAFHYCQPSGDGVWVVQLSGAQLVDWSGSCAAMLHYGLAHVTAPGHAVTSEGTRWSRSGPHGDQSVLEISQYDYDGDGRDELLVRTTSNDEKGHRSLDRMEVLRAGTKGVEPYPVPFDYTDMTDADGDGRPDLVDIGFFTTRAECGFEKIWFMHGPPLLIHTLPNHTFSMADETARAWAVGQCPTLPAPPFVDAKSAVCARLWGKSAKDVVDLARIPNVPCKNTIDPKIVLDLVSPKPPFTTLDQATPLPLPPKK